MMRLETRRDSFACLRRIACVCVLFGVLLLWRGALSAIAQTQLVAWGNNANGQLGDGTTSGSIVPLPALAANVTAVASGLRHTLALKSDGTVSAWGWNGVGELGNGTTSFSNSTPSDVSGLTDVRAIAAGWQHSVALKNDGTVWTWGGGFSGQLGNGTLGSQSVPGQVSGLSNVAAIAAGEFYCLALKNDGTVWAWGENTSGQLGDGTYTRRSTPVQLFTLSGITSIAAGSNHSLARRNDGAILVWGNNSNGQLGDGTFVNNRNLPYVLPQGGNQGNVVAGGNQSFLLRPDGSVLAWGENNSGQLGDGTNQTRRSPVALGIANVATLASGFSHTLALKTDGTVWSWGDNSNGQLGNPAVSFQLTPTQVAELFDVTAIGAGNSSSFAVKTQATVLYASGYNAFGQLGDGTTTNRNVAVQVSLLRNVVQMAGGQYHSLAVKSDGTVWTWGDNSDGQLGDGTMTLRSLATQVPSFINAAKVAGGEWHSIALRTDGTVAAWGGNSSGQLGTGSFANSLSPVTVSGLTDVAAIASGSRHNLAVKSNGTVWTWGNNDSGQLGDFTYTNSSVPVPVEIFPPNSAVAVAGGYFHSLVILNDGTMLSWGNNGSGQLGNSGFPFGASSPLPVENLTNVAAIAAGNYHSLALKTDGTLWVWGLNDSGQLGIGNTTNSNVPVQVLGLSGVVAIAAGERHSVAVKSDGTVWAWGENTSGQVGDGTFSKRNSPVQMLGLNGITGVAAGREHNLFLNSTTIATTGNVAGNITLQGIVTGAPVQTVTFSFTPTSGSPFNKTATIDASGTYSLSGVAAGTYSVRIKSPKNLAKVMASVTVTAGGTVTVDTTLIAGDATNDNAADISDLLVLINAYNKVSPNVGYNEAADFNGDGANDITDLLLLIGNYNQIGE